MIGDRILADRFKGSIGYARRLPTSEKSNLCLLPCAPRKLITSKPLRGRFMRSSSSPLPSMASFGLRSSHCLLWLEFFI